MGSKAAVANNQSALTFDAETHTYRIDGERVPSVTQVLQGAGIIDTRWFTEEACTRGTYVALATQWHDEGTLDYDALDEGLKPYLRAWEGFMRAVDAKIVLIEERVFNPTLRYAGTLDRLLEWGGRLWLVDIKTGSKAAWHSLQTAAYAECLGTPRRATVHRASIVLAEDATYKFSPHRSSSDRDVFRSALNLYHWKSEKGLLT